MFDDTAKPLLGISAPDIAEVHERDYDEYDSFFRDVLDQTCYFTLRVALVIFRVSRLIKPINFLNDFSSLFCFFQGKTTLELYCSRFPIR